MGFFRNRRRADLIPGSADPSRRRLIRALWTPMIDVMALSAGRKRKIRWAGPALVFGAFLLLFIVGMLRGAPVALNPRFVDSGDGTILDVHTGLLWQKCSYGQRYDGNTCRGTAIRLRWQDAIRQCANLRAIDFGLPGNREWELPVQGDLEGLLYVRPSGERPFIDLDFFSASHPLRYWSRSAQIDGGGTQGVVVNFLDGTVYGDRAGVGDSDGKNYARCVDVGRRAASTISSAIDRK